MTLRELMNQIERTNGKKLPRHDVRPDLSGWAQMNGRNAIDSWEQRFVYDLE